MNLDWLACLKPGCDLVVFSAVVSTANIALWMLLHRRFRPMTPSAQRGILRVEILVLLCAAYVFGCAFRSVLPRADVQRITLFDTWLSSVFVGRSVATIAEICFVLQWAIVLHQLAKLAKADTARNIAKMIVPLILLAETFSWYAVITTNYLGNTLENSLWAVTFLLIAVALLRLLNDFRGAVRLATWIGGRRDYRLSGLPGESSTCRCISSDGEPMQRAARSCSACLPACTISARVGPSRTTSRNGRTKLPGCRFISAWRYGRAWRWGALAW